MEETSNEPDFTQEDLQVFLQYGLTILSVQRFEQALKQLAQLYAETPKDATFEQAWRDVRNILMSAAGPLTKRLTERGEVSEELLEELRKATKGRNHLAHDYLLWYVLQKKLGQANPEDEIAWLQQAEQRFGALYAELSELSRLLLRERGTDPEETYITEERGREILWQMSAKQEDDEGQ